MGQSDPAAPTHTQQSMILVPMDAPGVTIRAHAERFRLRRCAARARRGDFEDVRVPASNLLLGEGRGFEIAQGTPRPRRIPSLHCG